MRRTAATAVLVLVAATCLAADPPPVIHHHTDIVFDVAAHQVKISDQVTLPAGVDTFEIDSGPVLTFVPGATADAGQGSYTGQTKRVAYGGQGAFTIGTFATAHQPTDQVRFSRENVGGELTATVGDEGIWLSGDTAWLPTVDGALHAGTFTIDTPAGWFPVMSGEITAQTEENGRRHTTYEITEPVDGLSFVANQFFVEERDHGGITMRTCFLERDQRLSDLYLERTAHYLDLYGEMLGEYPYRSFTTVENWFPTGYGMPGWTLLGSQVLRLPFIPYISFGHEIAHNWWGNSVFVDSEGGNWCEGLTVWCADYLYKLEESPEAAHQYRRNQLKDYAAYVGEHPEIDFPLTEFKSRHSGATRAVGYGKSMAVWHMLEQELGRDAVIEALRAVYRDFRGRPAAWNDFFAAVEKASGRDLTVFREQWYPRTGAPTLTLTDVVRDGATITFTLGQTEPVYDLLVPVVARTPRDDVRQHVRLTTAEETFTLEAAGATELAIDPDNDLFRHLDPTEIEPTLSQIFAVDEHVFVAPLEGGLLKIATGDFARDFCECDEPDVREDGVPDPDAVNVLVNPDPAVLDARLPAELRVHGDLVFLGGTRISLKDHDLVFATASPGGSTDLVVLTRHAGRLRGLGSRLGHYGKYSWLSFPAAGGRVERGNWQPEGNPLAVPLLP